jgi:NADPH:quinone reductase-like Zn-dependent oxidoreductase
MKSLSMSESSPTPEVKQDAVTPRPGRGELLIRVCAAGLTPMEVLWYPTSHRETGELRRGAVLGHEFSGVVAAIGEGVGCLEIGREVFGMNDWFSDGAMADYCVAPFFALAPKPPCLSYVEAAAVPISALTAWQGLFDHARLQPGERVLVHGGAGGVGTFAVQLARQHGAHVITTTSAANADLARDLGAEAVIDYRAGRFEECAHTVDVVFDTVGGDTLERSWSILKPGGRLVTVVSEAESTTDPRIKQAFFIVEPNQKQLFGIADLLERGRLRTVVDEVVPLSRAPEIYAGSAPRRHRGKVVIEVAEIAN